MGGSGSGRYYRSSDVTTLEELPRLETKHLNTYGLLSEGRRSATWSWNRGGEPSGSVNLKSDGYLLTVTWRSRPWDKEEWSNHEQRIKILHTPCNYGGYRKWLECPYCKRRMGVLALGNDGFACRHCYHLPYASESESKEDRLLRVQRKLAGRIFEDEELGIRKKGMHWKTFERLLEKHDHAEQVWSQRLLSTCQKIGLDVRWP